MTARFCQLRTAEHEPVIISVNVAQVRMLRPWNDNQTVIYFDSKDFAVVVDGSLEDVEAELAAAANSGK